MQQDRDFTIIQFCDTYGYPFPKQLISSIFPVSPIYYFMSDSPKLNIIVVFPLLTTNKGPSTFTITAA